jgi:hypothetical protein
MARARDLRHRREWIAVLGTTTVRALRRAAQGAALGVLATVAACGGASGPQNGVQQCAPVGTSPSCPDGYACQADNHCWKNGTGPDGGLVSYGDATYGTDGANPPNPTDGGNGTDGTNPPSPTDGANRADGANPQGSTDGANPQGSADGANPQGSTDGANPQGSTDAAAGADYPPSSPDGSPSRDLRPPSPDLPPPPDLAPPPPPVAPPAGHRMVPAGTVSRSAKYLAIQTLGQMPGSVVMQSSHYRAVRGIVGATQPK